MKSEENNILSVEYAYVIVRKKGQDIWVYTKASFKNVSWSPKIKKLLQATKKQQGESKKTKESYK